MITIKEQKIYLFKSVKNLELKKYCFNFFIHEKYPSCDTFPCSVFCQRTFFQSKICKF
jgi:hypothetical protein